MAVSISRTGLKAGIVTPPLGLLQRNKYLFLGVPVGDIQCGSLVLPCRDSSQVRTPVISEKMKYMNEGQAFEGDIGLPNNSFKRLIF